MRHGPPDGRVLVFHVGTPNAPDEFPRLTRALDERGWQLARILAELGLDRFVTRWSGGGPHALACAALLPDRCDAAASLAGVAPFDAEGLDFMAGMGAENVEEFGAAARSPGELRTFADRLAGVWPSSSRGASTSRRSRCPCRSGRARTT
jgi:pimeloyl-ACP methyl ester carboxylesterase